MLPFLENLQRNRLLIFQNLQLCVVDVNLKFDFEILFRNSVSKFSVAGTNFTVRCAR